MKKYLQVDCRSITLAHQDDRIVIRIPVAVKADLYAEQPSQITLTNQQLLAEKEAQYAEMFKSKVVYPPPPPEPQRPPSPPRAQEDKVEQPARRGESIFQSSSKENENRSIFGGSSNIFGADRRQQRSAATPSESIFGRSEQRDQGSSSMGSSWRNSSIFSAGTAGRSSSGSGSSPSNVFMMGPGGNTQPSLFSGQAPQENSNNTRRSNRNSKVRIC